MKNTKEQKGITLIALIITIIVMLILVAVTVSVALDGGLFGKASNASNDTKEAVERESLQDFILGEMDVENGIIPGTFVKTYTDSDGKTWTVTAEEEEEDIEITLTNGTDVITKKLKGDLKISGVTVKKLNKEPVAETRTFYGVGADKCLSYFKLVLNSETSEASLSLIEIENESSGISENSSTWFADIRNAKFIINDAGDICVAGQGEVGNDNGEMQFKRKSIDGSTSYYYVYEDFPVAFFEESVPVASDTMLGKYREKNGNYTGGEYTLAVYKNEDYCITTFDNPADREDYEIRKYLVIGDKFYDVNVNRDGCLELSFTVKESNIVDEENGDEWTKVVN